MPQIDMPLQHTDELCYGDAVLLQTAGGGWLTADPNSDELWAETLHLPQHLGPTSPRDSLFVLTPKCTYQAQAALHEHRVATARAASSSDLQRLVGPLPSSIAELVASPKHSKCASHLFALPTPHYVFVCQALAAVRRVGSGFPPLARPWRHNAGIPCRNRRGRGP